MRAFTIWQPWASLIMIGAKPYEFRPRSYREYLNPPKPGERIVIHSAVRPVRYDEVSDLLQKLDIGGEDTTGLIEGLARPLLDRVRNSYKCQALPLGCGLGTAMIGPPCNAADIFGRLVHDSDRGDFNWAWPLSDIQPFDAPVPARGFQGFWKWTASRIAA